MSGATGDRRRVVGGVLLAGAGIYILFQPFGSSPGSCAGSLVRLTGDIGPAVGMCVSAAAALFVVGSIVGLVSIVAALWILLPGAAGSRTPSLLLAAAILAIVGAGTVAFVTSPTGPFRTFAPTQTAAPAQTSPPTRGP